MLYQSEHCKDSWTLSKLLCLNSLQHSSQNSVPSQVNTRSMLIFFGYSVWFTANPSSWRLQFFLRLTTYSSGAERAEFFFKVHWYSANILTVAFLFFGWSGLVLKGIYIEMFAWTIGFCVLTIYSSENNKT